MINNQMIYKILPRGDWELAQKDGVFKGSVVDKADGFIHFSTADQTAETAAKHFKGQDDLVLVAIDSASLGDMLKWEVSRGGALFPHLYRNLNVDEAIWSEPMPLDQNGIHQLPVLKNQ